MNIFSIPVQTESPVYKKSPLMQTIFRVDYAETPIGLDHLEEFRRIIISEMPGYERKHLSSVLVSPGFAQQYPDLLHHHIFRSENVFDQIEISPSFFTFLTIHYEGWEGFLANVEKYFNAFQSIVHVQLNRISLRFVNFLPEELLLKKDLPLNLYINPSLCGPMVNLPFLAPPVTEYSGNLEWKIGNNDYVHLSYGTGAIRDIKEKFFYLDTTVFGFGSDSNIHLSDRLNLFHDKAYDVFRWGITEELHEYFNTD